MLFHSKSARQRAVDSPAQPCFVLGRKLFGALFGSLLWLGSPIAAASLDPLVEPALIRPEAERSLMLELTGLGDRLVAVGERGHVIYSDDLGKRWSQAQVPVSVTLTAVQFLSPRNGWAVGHDGVVLQSHDGGVSWEKRLDGNEANRLAVEAAERVFSEAESAHQRGEIDAMSLEDFQFALEDLQNVREQGPVRPFLDLLFTDANTGFVVGAYGMIFRTRDGGESWESVSALLDNSDGFHLNAIASGRQGELFIVGEAGLIFRSLDGGERWQRLDSPYEGTFFGVLPSPQGWLIAYGLRGNSFLSTDRGGHWTRLTSGIKASLTGGALLDQGKKAVLVSQAGDLLLFDGNTDQLKTRRLAKGLPLQSVVVLDGGPQRDGEVAVAGVGGVHIDRLEFTQQEVAQ